MSNKSVGNRFEITLCNNLAMLGFWAHNFRQDVSGQPADVIAVRNRKAYLIDCKVCSGESFDLRRMEENQDLSMTRWEECGNGQGWFAVQCKDLIYMFSHDTIKKLRETRSSVPFKEFKSFAVPFGEWVDQCE